MRFTRRPKPPPEPPEWLIVGLGNPGPEYRGTRHNVGFEVIDELMDRHRIKLTERKHRALYGAGRINGVPVVLVKPMTYMNLSGDAVAALAREYRLGAERVLVVADDLDLGTGVVRIRRKGSAGGHRGHSSIIASLGSEDYPRIKIGIGKRGEAADHVLSRFRPDEIPLVGPALDRAADACEIVLKDGLDEAMRQVHSGEPTSE